MYAWLDRKAREKKVREKEPSVIKKVIILAKKTKREREIEKRTMRIRLHEQNECSLSPGYISPPLLLVPSKKHEHFGHPSSHRQ